MLYLLRVYKPDPGARKRFGTGEHWVELCEETWSLGRNAIDYNYLVFKNHQKNRYRLFSGGGKQIYV